MNRKLDTARVFERLFAVYQAQFTLLVPAALILFVPVAVLNGLLAAGGGGIGLALVIAIVGFVANFWFQGMVIEAVRDIQDGQRDFSVGGLFQSVMPVLPKLIGVGVLAGIGIVIGLVLLIIPGLILLTLWAVIGPAVVIEKRGLDAFSRSMELVKGNGWNVFGVIVVVFLIQFVAGLLLGAIFGNDTFVGQALASLISGALIAPIGAIAAALVYLELRELKGEGTPHAGGIGGSGDQGTDAFGRPAAPLSDRPESAAPASGGQFAPPTSAPSPAPAAPAPSSGDPLSDPPPSSPSSGDPLSDPPPPSSSGDPLTDPPPPR